MQILLRTIFLAITLFTSATVVAYDFKRVLDQHIEPSYKALSRSTSTLLESANAYCKSAKPADLATTQQRFNDAFMAWQAVQHIRFGPIQYASREHRFQLWPDKRGSVGKHLAAILDEAGAVNNADDLRGRSVAVQGFGALEQLLYQDTSIDANACSMVRAIAENLAKMSAEVYRDWMQSDSPYAQFFVAPSEDNYIYESEQELAGVLLNAMYSEFELITTQKLDRPLAASIEQANGRRSEGWRSQTSLLAVQSNLHALQQLYSVAFSDVVSDALRQQIDRAFDAAKQSAQTVTIPLSQAVSDSAERSKVERLRQQISELKKLFAQPLAAELGLSLGFNSLDGD